MITYRRNSMEKKKLGLISEIGQVNPHRNVLLLLMS